MFNLRETSTLVSAISISGATFFLVNFPVILAGINVGIVLLVMSGIISYYASHKVVSWNNRREIYGKRVEELENELSRIVSNLVKVAAQDGNPSLEQFSTGEPIIDEALSLIRRKLNH